VLIQVPGCSMYLPARRVGDHLLQPLPHQEDVLFADADERLDLIHGALSQADLATPTFEVLGSPARWIFDSPSGFGPNRDIRTQLALSHPELRAKGLARLLTATANSPDGCTTGAVPGSTWSSPTP
jgi:hypothetical protein